MDVTKSAGLSRRTIVKGAAWSVPVIAAAVAVPMAAASTDPLDLGNLWTSSAAVNAINISTGSFEIVTQDNPIGSLNGAITTVTITYTPVDGNPFSLLEPSLVQQGFYTLMSRSATTLVYQYGPIDARPGYVAPGINLSWSPAVSAPDMSLEITATVTTAEGYHASGLRVNTDFGDGWTVGPRPVS